MTQTFYAHMNKRNLIKGKYKMHSGKIKTPQIKNLRRHRNS
jgi:hypothetical protein